MTAPALEVRDLEVRLGGAAVLSGVDLTVAPGEVLALLGPSGCGKTTLLAAVAGFLTPAAGEILLDGVVVSTRHRVVPPERRSIGFVFQSYALWPHLSARETVAFPMVAAGVPGDEAERRTDEILAALGLAALGGRRPAELSGGQQQRVGVARALGRDAALFLLDEPTAHLDAATRLAAEAEIAVQRRVRGAAAVHATHDPAEALGVADRVAVMRGGRIVQCADPVTVYQQPADGWVAAMTGVASVVTLPGRGRVVIRPEWVRLGDGDAATVSAVRFRGPHVDLTLDTPHGDVVARVVGSLGHRVGDVVRWDADTWPVPD